MQERFTPKETFTNQEFEKLVIETQLGRAPTSMDKAFLEKRQLSEDQLKTLFDRNLTRNHTISVMAYGNSMDKIDLYKKHLQKEHNENVSPIVGTAKNLIQKTKQTIEKNKGNMRID